MMLGIEQLAEQMLDIPVRLGQINNFDHIPDEINSIRYATAHGLLLYGFHHEPIKGGSAGKMRGILRKFEKWITKKL